MSSSGTTFGIENTLLVSSLLCGLGELGAVAYRLQLLFVAARDLDSGSHINDYQRAIESGVDRKRYWLNAGGRGSGEYSLTEAGRAAPRRWRKRNAFPRTMPRFGSVTFE